MVKYYGRAKQRTGTINTNQVGLKMSGCPSRIGRQGKTIRLLGRRVNCMYGLCGPTMVNGAPWRTTGRNVPPYCRQRSTACAQAAGGVGNINSPYTRTRVPAAGQQGCTQVIVGNNVSNTGSLIVTNEQVGGAAQAAYISAAYVALGAGVPVLGSASAITPANLREIYLIIFNTTSPTSIFQIYLKGNQPPGFSTLRIELGNGTTRDLSVASASVTAPVVVGGQGIWILNWLAIPLTGAEIWSYNTPYTISFL